LLKEKGIPIAFKVPTLDTQKLINKKDIRPINSQPKNSTIKFPDDTKINILIIKEDKNNINLSTRGSYLK
jgi:hypothetical protein